MPLQLSPDKRFEDSAMHFCSVAYYFDGQPYRYDFGTDRRCNITVHLALQQRYPGAILTAIHWHNSQSIAA